MLGTVNRIVKQLHRSMEFASLYISDNPQYEILYIRLMDAYVAAKDLQVELRKEFDKAPPKNDSV